MDIFGLFIRLLPKSLVSYLVGLIVHVPLPEPIGSMSVKWFAERYKINMEEAEYPIDHYKSIGALFTRKLKPGIRPVSESAVVHPADSEITSNGVIKQGLLFQAKGKTYSLDRFLGQKSALEDFEGGQFVTYYLCPTDYHRVHSPVEGEIEKITYIPGRLWPVNPWSVEHISQLFSVNERVVVWIRTSRGLVALVMVGATNVGKMTLSFDPEIITNQPVWDQEIIEKQYSGLSVAKAQELGIFNMGSTVIMVYPEDYLKKPIKEGFVKLGEALSE